MTGNLLKSLLAEVSLGGQKWRNMDRQTDHRESSLESSRKPGYCLVWFAVSLKQAEFRLGRLTQMDKKRDGGGFRRLEAVEEFGAHVRPG
jgi:hypothetical protein